MTVLGGVKVEHVPHLMPTSPILVHVCLNQISLPTLVYQELKIKLDIHTKDQENEHIQNKCDTPF